MLKINTQKVNGINYDVLGGLPSHLTLEEAVYSYWMNRSKEVYLTEVDKLLTKEQKASLREITKTKIQEIKDEYRNNGKVIAILRKPTPYADQDTIQTHSEDI